MNGRLHATVYGWRMVSVVRDFFNMAGQARKGMVS